MNVPIDGPAPLAERKATTASDEEMIRRHELAEEVARSLRLGGLTVTVDRGPSGGSSEGVVVEVDAGADGAGGVSVSWLCDDELVDELEAPVRAGNAGHPAVLRNEQVGRVMQEAMLELLVTDGFNAQLSADEYQAFYVEVHR